MPHVIELHDFSDPALDVYARATENQLVNRADPANALFIAESPLVIGRALDAGCVPVSFLMETQHVAGKGAALLERCDPDIPVYTASLDVLTRLTGFHLTRGILCAMRRPPLPEGDWPALLHDWGFTTAAMALRQNSLRLDDPLLARAEKLAVVLGTEGDGLAPDTIAHCDHTVMIPMTNGVDSLNVAAAAAVAFYQLGLQSRPQE